MDAVDWCNLINQNFTYTEEIIMWALLNKLKLPDQEPGEYSKNQRQEIKASLQKSPLMSTVFENTLFSFEVKKKLSN